MSGPARPRWADLEDFSQDPRALRRGSAADPPGDASPEPLAEFQACQAPPEAFFEPASDSPRDSSPAPFAEFRARQGPPEAFFRHGRVPDSPEDASPARSLDVLAYQEPTAEAYNREPVSDWPEDSSPAPYLDFQAYQEPLKDSPEHTGTTALSDLLAQTAAMQDPACSFSAAGHGGGVPLTPGMQAATPISDRLRLWQVGEGLSLEMVGNNMGPSLLAAPLGSALTIATAPPAHRVETTWTQPLTPNSFPSATHCTLKDVDLAALENSKPPKERGHFLKNKALAFKARHESGNDGSKQTHWRRPGAPATAAAAEQAATLAGLLPSAVPATPAMPGPIGPPAAALPGVVPMPPRPQQLTLLQPWPEMQMPAAAHAQAQMRPRARQQHQHRQQPTPQTQPQPQSPQQHVLVQSMQQPLPRLLGNPMNQPQAQLSSGKQPAVPGSILHAAGKCRPCAWYWKPKGCMNELDCSYCHLCPEGELKARKKSKVVAMRMGALTPVQSGSQAGIARRLRLAPLLGGDA